MTILAYHSIDDDWDDPLAVTAAAFQAQMARVARMTPLPLPQYVARLRELRLPRGAVAVTFDDGYRNLLTRALPICESLGIACAAFVTTANIDRGEPLGGRPESRSANRPLAWEEVRALARAGWTIGSHTVTHRDLVAATDDEELAAELTASRTRIAEMLADGCEIMSYPYGRHDERVRSAVATAGYTAALTLPTGREYHDTSLAIPRIGVFRGDSPAAFRLKLLPKALAAKLALMPPHAVEGADHGERR